MNYKVIITGPVGSGKTTAVNSLTEKNAMLTDAVVSDADAMTKQRKRTTTVAMDYDVVRLNDNMVHVYGTPGQERFDFMWDILSQGAHGVILLLDNTRNYPFRDLKYYTNRFAKLIKSSRLILGVTRFDLKTDPPVEAYKHWLKTLGLEADVIMVDAREKADITQLFYKLLDIPCDDEVSSDSDTVENTIEEGSSETGAVSQGQGEDTKRAELKDAIQLDTQSLDNSQSEAADTAFASEDIIRFDETMLNKIESIDGITGATLTNSMGELLNSTIKNEELNELIAFLSGVTPEIEKTLNRGKIHRIMLRSPSDDNLTVFVEKEKSLGVSSSRRKSVQVLSQQVEDMLQWM